MQAEALVETPTPTTSATETIGTSLDHIASHDPAALFALAEAALTGNILAEEILLQTEFNVPAYLAAASQDYTVLPDLAVLAELGCSNVHYLLAQMVAQGPQDIFFNLAGVAIEGSAAAFSVLNECARFDHLAALIDFLYDYQSDEVYGPMLTRLVQSHEFCPRALEVAATGDSYVLGFADKLAEWGNPYAQEFRSESKAVGYQH